MLRKSSCNDTLQFTTNTNKRHIFLFSVPIRIPVTDHTDNAANIVTSCDLATRKLASCSSTFIYNIYSKIINNNNQYSTSYYYKLNTFCVLIVVVVVTVKQGVTYPSSRKFLMILKIYNFSLSHLITHLFDMFYKFSTKF